MKQVSTLLVKESIVTTEIALIVEPFAKFYDLTFLRYIYKKQKSSNILVRWFCAVKSHDEKRTKINRRASQKQDWGFISALRTFKIQFNSPTRS